MTWMSLGKIFHATTSQTAPTTYGSPIQVESGRDRNKQCSAVNDGVHFQVGQRQKLETPVPEICAVNHLLAVSK